MRCGDVMKGQTICLGVHDSALDAARLMRRENIGFIPICDSSGRVLGTITDRDVALRVLAQELPISTALGEVMTKEVVACRASDDLARAQQLMEQHQKSRILCLDESDRLVGVISLSDIARRGDAGNTLRQIKVQREALS